MSNVFIKNTTNTIKVQSTGTRGLQGEPGLYWINDDWTAGTEYTVDQALYYNGSSYRVIQTHIADLTNLPGEGADWVFYWEILALGAEIADIDIIVGIANDIQTVAAIAPDVSTVANIANSVVNVENISTEIQVVSGIANSIVNVDNISNNVVIVSGITANVNIVAGQANNISTVAGIANSIVSVADNTANVSIVANNIPAIQTTANNIAAIIAAPDYAEAAANSAIEAAASAALISVTPFITYGVSLYYPDDLPAGGWIAERYVAINSEQTVFYAEILEGDVGSQSTIVMLVNSIPVLGPVTVNYGTPLIINNLSILIESTDNVDFMFTPSSGIRRMYVKTQGRLR